MTIGTINGTVTGSSASAYEIKIDWSDLSNGADANSSNLTATLKFRRVSSLTYPSYNLGGAVATLSCTGETTYTKNNVYYDTRSSTSWITLASKTWTVDHNTDGSKTVTLSASFTANAGSGMTGGSVSGSAKLTTIPRASVLGTIPDFTFDSAENIAASFFVPCTKYTPSCYDVLTIKIDGTTIATEEDFTSGDFSFSETQVQSAYAAMPTDNAKTFTFELCSYTDSSKNTLIGSPTPSKEALGSISLTGRAPYFNKNEISYLDIDAKTINMTSTSNTQIIKSKSDLKVKLSENTDGHANKGAVLNEKCYSLIASGHTTQTANDVASSTEVTFENILTNTFTVQLRDSRGNVCSENYTISEFFEYTGISITSFTASRANPEYLGTGVAFKITGSFHVWPQPDNEPPVPQNNLLIAKWRWKETDVGSYSPYANIITNNDLVVDTENGTFTYSGVVSNSLAAIDKSYTFELEVQDCLTKDNKTASITTINPTLDINTEQLTVGIGGLASIAGPGLQVFGTGDFSGDLQVFGTGDFSGDVTFGDDIIVTDDVWSGGVIQTNEYFLRSDGGKVARHADYRSLGDLGLSTSGVSVSTICATMANNSFGVIAINSGYLTDSEVSGYNGTLIIHKYNAYRCRVCFTPSDFTGSAGFERYATYYNGSLVWLTPNTRGHRELLWSGSWSSGNISCDLGDYIGFELLPYNTATLIWALKSTDNARLRGQGGYSTSGTNVYKYDFNADISGTTLSLLSSTVFNLTTGNILDSNRAILAIYGVM